MSGPLAGWHQHRLDGCAPEPLAHYLKALAILRIVGEQADPFVRGAWRDGAFVLVTQLDKDALERFFLERYAPLPLISPWNKGSGLLAAKDEGVGPIEASKAPRFEDFREGIRAAKELSQSLAEADLAVRATKDEANRIKDKGKKEALKKDPEYKRRLAAADRAFKRLKEDFIPRCRLLWRGPHLRWLDAALVISDANKVGFPALLGTGGNDGRLDFTNNAMKRLGELFDLKSESGAPLPGTAEQLRAALWGTPSRGVHKSAPVGQYLPGSAGGANATSGPDGGALVNPWDFVLMLEGTPLFAAVATRRLQTTMASGASAPFTVRSRAVGFGTAAAVEESARGEQWMPLWGQLATLGEVTRLLGEGRAEIGGRRAERPVDLARAIAQLGVERGLTGFQRYGYLERNGQSNLAVSLGRIEVGGAHPRAHLIDSLAAWLDRLHQKARAKNAPRSLAHAERRVADAVFAALTRPPDPLLWQNILLALGGVEDLLVPGSPAQAGPVPELHPDWVEAADDGSPELRLAVAFAQSVAGWRKGVPIDAVRRHILPLDRRGRLVTRDGKVAQDPRVVSPALPALDALAFMVQRRLFEAGRRGERRLPIQTRPKSAASLSDLERWLAGELDVERCWRLARILTAVRIGDVSVTPGRHAQLPEDPWIVTRLALMPFNLPIGDNDRLMSTPGKGRNVPADQTIVRRLLAGDTATATAMAARRLRGAGLVTPITTALSDRADALRVVASLAFPISQRSAAILCRRLVRFQFEAHPETSHGR